MSGYYLLKNGEFAYNKSYSVGYDFGSIKRLDRYPMGALSTLYICFALKRHESDFIKAYFDSLKWYREIYMISAEGARNHGLLNVPTEEFFDTKHYLPENTNEQRKIADFLIALDRRIETQQSLVDNLKKYKRGLLNYVFSSKQHYKNTWTKKKIGEFCSITMGQSPDSNSYNSECVGVPLVQGNADITDGVTTPYRYTSQPTKVCKKGSILLSVRAPVGTVCIADREVCLGRGVCAINSENNAFVRQLFLYLEPSWKTIEQGGTFTAINRVDIENVEVLIPNNVNEQKRIGEYLGLIDLHISQEEKILQSFLSIKLGLLQQLFI
ncbi:MAG: restriction endonuclease subunit S [Eubacteriales bacterium]|nr:restriction endonuclease subunit S [Eubacteriales bacterium]